MTKGEIREEQARLFVASDLPEAWKAGLGELQDAMRTALNNEPGPPRLRWVRPESIHLTLKFLGETPLSRLESIENALKAAVPEAPGFSLGLGRAGSFSDRRAPRVILATLNGGGQRLLGLVESIETWLASAGFPRERRSFQPHLTLARLPDDLSPALREHIAELTNAVPPPRLEEFSVESVSLMRSYPGPGGTRYEKLGTFPQV